MANRFPPQIKYIIGNEACERFSYYGMKSILVVFLTGHLLLAQHNASAVFHFFAAGCYLTPLLGAFLADRYLGKYTTIMSLSVVYCLGHLVLALFENEAGIYTGLALVALGCGGIKPCVSAYVGDQFNEKNKDLLPKVFDYFYFSINFGSFFSTLLIPVVLVRYGSGWAFGIPGILMAIATLIFWSGRKHYVDVPPTRGTEGSAGFVPIVAYALKNLGKRQPGQEVLEIARAKYSAEEVEGAKAAAAIFKVFVTVSMFWALFDQHASSWVLQAMKMDPVFMGWKIEPSQIQALNPIMVMVLIPLFTYGLYPLVQKLGIQVTPLRKMSVGMALAAFSFLVVGIFQAAMDSGITVNIMWLAVPFLILTASEVMVSITGLEFAYTQAPRAMKSTIMSFWLITVFAGNLFASVIAEMNKFSGATYFYFYAILMFGVSFIFMYSASKYKVRNFIENGKPEGNGAGHSTTHLEIAPSTAT